MVDFGVKAGEEMSDVQKDTIAQELFGSTFDALYPEEQEKVLSMLDEGRKPDYPSALASPASPLVSKSFGGGQDESAFLAEGSTPLSALASKYEAPMQAAKQMERDAAAEMLKGSTPMTREQALYSTALAILPALVGAAFKGRRGAAAGIQASGVGVGSMFKDRAVTDERERMLAKLKYQNAADMREMLQKEALKLTGKEAELQTKSKLGLGKTNINFGGFDLGNDKPFTRQVAKDLLTDRGTTDAVIDGAQMVDQLLSGMDQNETVAGALGRGVKAGLFPSSDVAQLKRDIKEYAIKEGKKSFPGAISDQERQYMLELKGGNFGITIGALRRIMARSELMAAASFNRKLKDAQGFFPDENIPLEPYQLSAPTLDRLKADYKNLPPRMKEVLPEVGAMFADEGSSLTATPEEEQLLKKYGL